MINHKHLILTASLIGGLFFASCGDEGDKNSPEADTGKSPVADSVVVDYDNISDEVFYESIGMVLGDGSRKNLQQAGMDTLVDFEKMEDGFSDGLRGETPGDMNTYIATVREFASGSQSGGEMSKLEIENGSYAIAVVEAMSFKMNASRLNIDSTDMMFDIMSEAYGKSLRGESGGITVPQANEIVDRHMKAIAKKASSEQIRKDSAFLAENKMHEDVQVTKEGIQYKVLQPGSGAQPTAASTVKVHYTGTLLDGTEFDSSVDKGEPIEFNLGGNLIQGWKLAIPLMKEGAKYRFWIPQELAYGANPRPGGPIKPYQMLIFDIELIEIVK